MCTVPAPLQLCGRRRDCARVEKLGRSRHRRRGRRNDPDGGRRRCAHALHSPTLSALTCFVLAGDGQVSFEEFAKLMMSLAAPPPPPQQQAGMLPPGAPGFPAGTGLGGGYPPPYGVGGPGFPGGAYQGGVPGSYPASTAPPMSSGNPVQARLTARASATHKAPHADMQTCSSQDMETFQRMNALDAEALRRIFRKFQEVDQVSLLEVVALPTCRTSRLVPQERTGMVDVNEFCRLLRVERSPFVERLFSMFDTDRGGLIDLKEFIVGACARLCCAVKRSWCAWRCAHSSQRRPGKRERRRA